MIFRKTGEENRRIFSKAVLLVTILPLWALWAYAYSTLESLDRELAFLPRFYGMVLYKQTVRARLEEAARLASRLEERGVDGVGGGQAGELTEETWEKLGLLFGPEESLVVVEREGLRIVHPSEPTLDTAGFLVEPDARRAFLRTLQRMDAKGSQGGFFSIDTFDDSGGSKKRCWFLTMVPVGEDLLFLLPVPEERLRLSGGILEDAHESLLEKRRRRFLRLTLPVVLVSSLCIGILCRQQGRPGRGRGT